MGNESIDFGPIVEGLKKSRETIRPGDYCKLVAAIDGLRELAFPKAYLDGLQDELFSMLGALRPMYSTSVYLAFYGLDDRAQYLKIGIAKNVKNRIDGIAVGNPLPNLKTYGAAFPDRDMAFEVEQALLRHMARDKIHGEWVYVKGLSIQAMGAVVESLAEVASEICGERISFHEERI